MEQNLVALVANAGTTTDVFTLADVSAVRNWDYSLPTLTQDKRFTERKPWSDSDAFKKAFFETYPVLKAISLDKLAAMGGAVLSLLTTDFSTKDLDLFVVLDDPCMSPEAAKAFTDDRIKRFIRDIYEFMSGHNVALKLVEEEKQKTKPDFSIDASKLYNLDQFRVRRVLNVFTVTVPVLRQRHDYRSTLTIQLVSTPHVSLADLLRQVDIACTGVAYYHNNVWFSPLSKFAFENLCFVVDGSRSNSAYVDRVIKYFDRGFDVIMPSLDTTKVRTRNFAFGEVEVVDLPKLNLVVRNVKGCKVLVQALKKRTPFDDGDLDDAVSATAGCFDEYTNSDGASELHAGAIIHHNIRCLLYGNFDGFIVAGEGSNYALAFRSRPTITDRMLVNSFESVKNDVYKNSTLNVGKLVAYFPILTPSQLVERTVTSYVALHEGQKRSRVVFFDAAYDRHMESVLDDLVAQQIADAKAKIVELEATPFVATTVTVESRAKPSTTKSPEEFFGAFFKQVSVQA
ncbi:hypothetical protein DYB32_009291 [Aphanomyces invadans]|uniref:Uncharacterized protein n=1 Tax=Aphanomyces invadans TaxID=157072 RepID=A0A3R7A8Y1_9STRA|nr:hypothetical protein DYB32_009291 [Aphanomyces invadans]